MTQLFPLNKTPEHDANNLIDVYDNNIISHNIVIVFRIILVRVVHFGNRSVFIINLKDFLFALRLAVSIDLKHTINVIIWD